MYGINTTANEALTYHLYGSMLPSIYLGCHSGLKLIRSKLFLLPFALQFIFGGYLLSQTSTFSDLEPIVGHPSITNFSRSQYHAHTQNWGAVQDTFGLLYFANGNGVLMYNGVDWQLVGLPGQSMVASIAIDERNQIFLGGWGTFGRLVYDPYGKPFYHSLSEALGVASDSVTRVFETIVTPEGVYFQTREAVYRYREGQPIHTWYFGEKQIGKLFFVNDRLLMKWHGRGIFELVDDQWQLLPDSEQFSEVFVYAILPFVGNKLLFAIDGSLLYLYDGKTFTHFDSEVNDYFKQHRFYCAIQISSGEYIFGTVNGGIVGMDAQGFSTLLINDPNFILSLNIRNFLVDQQNRLWVAMDAGIAQIDYPSPYTLFGLRQEEVDVNFFLRNEEQLYAGTETGLLKYKKPSFGPESFVGVSGFDHKIWGLVNWEGHLLISDEYGVHRLSAKGIKETILTKSTSGAQVSTIRPDRLYLFLQTGMTTLEKIGNTWKEIEVLSGFNHRIHKIIEVDQNNLWIDTDWDELWRVHFPGDSGLFVWNNPEFVKYDTAKGLPSERGNLYHIANELYFVAQSMLVNYRWNQKTDLFEIDTMLHTILNTSLKDIIIYDVDNYGNCWYVTNDDASREHLHMSIMKEGGVYEPSGMQFDRILDNMGSCMFIDNGSIWHGGFSQIVKQEIKEKLNPPPYKALINKIDYRTDSILAYGNYNKTYPQLDYRQNAMTFHFSATDFISTGGLLFQTFLEGYDTEWSGWIKEQDKQYIGLPPGKYTFSVKATNSENLVSEQAHFNFRILTPWYEQWWVYVLYLIGGISIVKGLVRWRSGQLIKEKDALEQIVRQRTEQLEIRNQELQDQKLTLAEQAKKLQEIDQLKTNLFANISHEFRTPLTLIKAPIEALERDLDKRLSPEETGMIRRNADRLLRLINQLLDLAKLDASSLQLDLTEGDISRFFRMEASSFSSLAAQKNIDFQVKIPTRQLWANFDREKLETIIYNLLNNAFKFTPSDGRITLNVDHSDDHLFFEVTDTGPGIAPEHLQQIFDRFYQGRKINQSTSGGTGIGLALCRELIKLMHGEITVKSNPGQGTSFYVKLPLFEIINSTISKDEDLPDMEKSHPVISSGLKKSQAGEMILVVEDHPDMRRYIRSSLKNRYAVLEAENGEEGLMIAMKEVPDLIITDTMMPMMDGHEFSKKIKNDERTSHIPIIMLTAKATLDNKIVGIEAGVDGYLTKPFNSLELEATIKGLLVERKRLRRLFSIQLLVSPKEITIDSLEQQFLEKVITLLESQHSDSTFGVPQMQVALNMSKTQLFRKLTAIANQSPSEFLRNFRLQRAAQILAKKGETVSQVAYSVGFENVPYFTNCFTALFGVSPSKYKEP